MQKIHIYAQQGDIAGVARKIANGVDIECVDNVFPANSIFDIEATDDFSNTALIIASEHGATDCVRILLEAGANPKRINHCDDKAIKIATNLEIFRMLIVTGEDVSNINNDMRRSLLASESLNYYSFYF
jgi:ankyrin repeat protein